MWSVDVLLGALWTLIAITLGVLIGLLIAIFFLADRGDEGDGEDPEPDPDDPLEIWLSENTTSPSFEANLLP